MLDLSHLRKLTYIMQGYGYGIWWPVSGTKKTQKH